MRLGGVHLNVDHLHVDHDPERGGNDVRDNHDDHAAGAEAPQAPCASPAGQPRRPGPGDDTGIVGVRPGDDDYEQRPATGYHDDLRPCRVACAAGTDSHPHRDAYDPAPAPAADDDREAGAGVRRDPAGRRR